MGQPKPAHRLVVAQDDVCDVQNPRDRDVHALVISDVRGVDGQVQVDFQRPIRVVEDGHAALLATHLADNLRACRPDGGREDDVPLRVPVDGRIGKLWRRVAA